jgi:hypothetical protein
LLQGEHSGDCAQKPIRHADLEDVTTVAQALARRLVVLPQESESEELIIEGVHVAMAGIPQAHGVDEVRWWNTIGPGDVIIFKTDRSVG